MISFMLARREILACTHIRVDHVKLVIIKRRANQTIISNRWSLYTVQAPEGFYVIQSYGAAISI
jgi:hypothetical protein